MYCHFPSISSHFLKILYVLIWRSEKICLSKKRVAAKFQATYCTLKYIASSDDERNSMLALLLFFPSVSVTIVTWGCVWLCSEKIYCSSKQILHRGIRTLKADGKADTLNEIRKDGKVFGTLPFTKQPLKKSKTKSTVNSLVLCNYQKMNADSKDIQSIWIKWFATHVTGKKKVNGSFCLFVEISTSRHKRCSSWIFSFLIHCFLLFLFTSYLPFHHHRLSLHIWTRQLMLVSTNMQSHKDNSLLPRFPSLILVSGKPSRQIVPTPTELPCLPAFPSVFGKHITGIRASRETNCYEAYGIRIALHLIKMEVVPKKGNISTVSAGEKKITIFKMDQFYLWNLISVLSNNKFHIYS